MASFDDAPHAEDSNALRAQDDGPFTPALNRALGESFGSSLAGVTVTRGADDAMASIGALAATSGSHIALSSAISEDLTDLHSMEVISHEVAHALGGGGSGDTLLDGPGDVGEASADAASDAFGHYAERGMTGPAPTLSAASGGSAAIHRWSLEGPWNKGDPVHETLTQEMLKQAGMLPEKGKYTDPAAWEYARGAIFNDDPTSQLFDDSATGPTNNYSSGLKFGVEFKGAEADAAKGKKFGVGDSMLKRSHFGDMQMLHGMAEEGEKPEVTKQKMMMWAEFTTKVAEGQIKGDAKIGELALTNPKFKEMLADDPTLKDMDVNHMFGIQGKGDVKARATGSLLHMIEDTYCSAHSEREDLGDGKLGALKNFHSYANQDHAKHAAADSAPDGPGTLEDKVKKMKGGQDAIDQGAAVLKLIKEGVPPDKVLEYLDQNTFKLAADASPAAAGKDFEKAAPPKDPGILDKAGKMFSSAEDAVIDTAVSGVDSTIKGVETVGNGIATGAKYVGNGIATGAKAVGNGIATGATAVGNFVSDEATALWNYIF